MRWGKKQAAVIRCILSKLCDRESGCALEIVINNYFKILGKFALVTETFFHVSLRYDIWSWGLKLYLCQIIKPIKSILTTFNRSTSCFSPHVKWDARSRSVCGAECHGKENCMAMVTCLHCATVLVRAINGLLEVTCHCFVVLCMIHNTLIYSQLQALFYGLWSYIAAYKCNALLLDRFWVAKVGCYWVQNDSVSKNIAWTVELKP